MVRGSVLIAGTALVGAVSLAVSGAYAQYWAPPPPPAASYYERGSWAPPPPAQARRYNDDRRDFRRCDRSGATILGAIAGGLLGNAATGRGDRSAGTVSGAGAGALAGRAAAC